MVNTVFNKFLLIAGFASLAHAAYSAAHCKLKKKENMEINAGHLIKIFIIFPNRSHLFKINRTRIHQITFGCKFYLDNI